MATAPSTREERDTLGPRSVPDQAYWGVHTLRASENFRISGATISGHGSFICALAAVKESAARANAALGHLEREKADAIVAACEEIRAGELHDQFIVDVIQGGAGTSTNMNANEVIANRALEHLGRPKGAYDVVHPLDHVNLAQSTNDVYPTALRLALHEECEGLQTAMVALRGCFARQGLELADALTIGRTQLQDAVPMTLGQTFTAYAVTVEEDELRLAEAMALMTEINLGATAIGTGINADPRYPRLTCEILSQLYGLPLTTAPNLVEATQDTGGFLQLSGVLRRIAVKISKICNDLRLLCSGPQAGLGEIMLPAVQAGSSIMPGKVNPVIPEVVNQVAFKVIGNDVTVTFAAEAGQLQLNAFEPIIAQCLFESIALLRAALVTLAERCVAGITVDRVRLRRTVERSAALATALNPLIGYGRAAEIARAAQVTQRSVASLVLERGWLTSDALEQALAPDRLSGVSGESAVDRGPTLQVLPIEKE
jgi:aspartate ammonia-lyase